MDCRNIAATLEGIEVEKAEPQVPEIFCREKLNFESMAVEVSVWDQISINSQAILNGAQLGTMESKASGCPTEYAIKNIQPKTTTAKVPEIAIKNISDSIDDDVCDSITHINFLTLNLDLPFEFKTGPSEDMYLPCEKLLPKAQKRLKKCKVQEANTHNVVATYSNSDDIDSLFEDS
ncbi:hypothetical protein BYT27DRAFT_7260943 [Phlegmacium glaucopus]|nr:hypothetical protein BYT27DRAFT_7260943 [Phlegmacium glaucopus]